MTRKRVMVFVSNIRTYDDLINLYPEKKHPAVQQAVNKQGFFHNGAFDICGMADGYLILILSSGADFIKYREGRSKDILFSVIKYAAEQLNADVIGLGSLTTSITHGGQDVVDYIEQQGWKLRVTHGDAGSAAAILDCFNAIGLSDEQTVSVIGAYGLIGCTISQELVRSGRKVILHGRDPDKLSSLRGSIKSYCGVDAVVTTDIKEACQTDLIITVTSHPGSLLRPDMVRYRTVIIDPAVPANVGNNSMWLTAQHDNIIINNAAQVRIPGIEKMSYQFGTFNDPDGCYTSYACFAETVANTIYGDTEHHVGAIDSHFMLLTQQRMRHAGFIPSIPRMYGRDVRDQLIKKYPGCSF